MMAEPLMIHASCVAINGRGVLVTGPSGSGKSDLCLRLIDRGAMLVSDDQTVLNKEGGLLLASPPATIAGQIEIRGLGIRPAPWESNVPVSLIIALSDRVERFPLVARSRVLLGLAVPEIALAGLEASAPLKVEWALAGLGA